MQIQPILGYFWAIFGLYQPPRPPPPLLDLGLPFLHILDPPLIKLYICDVMWSSKMSPNLQILISRYHQTKQIISLFPIVFATFQQPLWANPFEFHTPLWKISETSPTGGVQISSRQAHFALLNKLYTPSVINLNFRLILLDRVTYVKLFISRRQDLVSVTWLMIQWV